VSLLVLMPVLTLLFAAILTPLVTALGKAVGFEKARDLFSIGAFAATLYYVFKLDLLVKASEEGFAVYHLEAYGPPFGVTYFVDSLSVYMAYVYVGVGLMVAVYSLRYMEKDSGLDKYYALLLAMVAGMIGVAFAGDFFNLFIFWETMSLSAYVLVAFRKHRWEPIEASFKYLVMSTFGSLLFLYAMSFLYGITGTLNFEALAQGLQEAGPSTLTMFFLVTMIVCGFGVTASVVPFHTWLPDAHPAAPASISAMLSGVVIKVGVYAIYRVLFVAFTPLVFDFGTVLMLFGILTMTVANIMALLQRDIKRLLAYSSIVNIGYILTGAGIGAYALTHYYSTAPEIALVVAGLAIMGALFHVFNHAVGKGLLFLCSGCFIHEAKTRDLAELEGIGKKMPWTGASFSVGLLTLAGVPPLSGFWSKLFIILAGFNMAKDPFMVGVTIAVVVNSVFAAAYYLWVMQRVMFRKPKTRAEGAREAPGTMVLPIVLLAAACVVVGIWPDLVIQLADSAAHALIGG